jgi:hypothetical protein
LRLCAEFASKVRETGPSGSVFCLLVVHAVYGILLITQHGRIRNHLQILNRKVGEQTMSLTKKLDQKTVDELRSILMKMNITQSKVKINLDNQTIEVDDDYSIDDILESAGTLTPEQAKQLADEVKRMREEEWN